MIGPRLVRGAEAGGAEAVPRADAAELAAPVPALAPPAKLSWRVDAARRRGLETAAAAASATPAGPLARKPALPPPAPLAAPRAAPLIRPPAAPSPPAARPAPAAPMPPTARPV